MKQMAKACCTIENPFSEPPVPESHHPEDHDHDSTRHPWLIAGISFFMLTAGLLADHFLWPQFFQNGILRLSWYTIAYIIVGFSVFKQAWETLKKGEVFTEFTLMTVATIGAFAVDKYPEGVSVMLFYFVGELFQSAAVSKAKNNIKSLLGLRPEEADVQRNNQWMVVDPRQVSPGEIIRVKVGEKVPLDGVMLSEVSSFNTSALTGESKPDTIRKGGQVLAGMLNLEKVVEVETTKRFEDSSLSKILKLVSEASSRKAKTELFIRKFAKIYTPAVFFLAVALMFLPYFFVGDYEFKTWFYRSMIFLVISCPCALLISIPLGYFGGIGAASAHGILVKGANYLDVLAKTGTVVMDKTGTLTEGVFKVTEVVSLKRDEKDFLSIISALESNSTHPIAKAITEYHSSEFIISEVEEIPGYGLKGIWEGKEVLAGNAKLLERFGIKYDSKTREIVESIVLTAVDGIYEGYILISDEIKPDAFKAIAELKKEGVRETVMLSGDKDSIVQKTAEELGITAAYGSLLPEKKVEKLMEIEAKTERPVAFVGDGINDAPVLAMADVGIAMGGLGSDAAIETADVVIQTDEPSKIPAAIRIGKATRQIVIQNIALAFGVKLIVLILGAGGMATMWEAVFADVGVALLAVLNAVRIQRMKF